MYYIRLAYCKVSLQNTYSKYEFIREEYNTRKYVDLKKAVIKFNSDRT